MAGTLHVATLLPPLPGDKIEEEDHAELKRYGFTYDDLDDGRLYFYYTSTDRPLWFAAISVHTEQEPVARDLPEILQALCARCDVSHLELRCASVDEGVRGTSPRAFVAVVYPGRMEHLETEGWLLDRLNERGLARHPEQD